MHQKIEGLHISAKPGSTPPRRRAASVDAMTAAHRQPSAGGKPTAFVNPMMAMNTLASGSYARFAPGGAEISIWKVAGGLYIRYSTAADTATYPIGDEMHDLDLPDDRSKCDHHRRRRIAVSCLQPSSTVGPSAVTSRTCGRWPIACGCSRCRCREVHHAALSAARLRDIESVSPEELEIALVAPEPTLVIRPRLYEPKPETLLATSRDRPRQSDRSWPSSDE